jgi:hypothetical protein
MDRSAARAIVDREIEPLMRRLGIPHWHVSVVYDLRADNTSATTQALCHTLVDYNRARIEIDPDAIDDEADLLRVLRHELMHVLLSPFDLVANTLRDALDDRSRAVLQTIQAYAQEQAVINLERMYRGLTKEPN